MGTSPNLTAPEEGRIGAAAGSNPNTWEAVVRLKKSGRLFQGDLSYLLDDFESYLLRELGRSPRTAEGYRQAVMCVARWARKPFWEISSNELRAFKRDAPYAAATKQHVVVGYHSLHGWAVQDEIDVLTRHSAKILAVITPSVSHIPKAPLAVHEARRLLAHCVRPLEYRMVYLGLYAGTRIEEAATIGPSEWRGDRLVFVGKARKQRTVPIHPELGRLQDVILSKQPSSAGVLHSVMKRLREQTGITDTAGAPMTNHSLRRTMADFMYDVREIPQEVVGAILGHGKKVTERYAQVRFDKMRRAIESIDYTIGEPVQLSLFA